MIKIECEQGTEEWFQARLGIPTASNFGRILTPKGAASKQADVYMKTLLIERQMGHPAEDDKKEGMKWIEHGKKYEADARNFYAFDQSVDVQQVGFITNDEGTIGCSPDGIIGDDGGLEIKCPKPSTQASYWLGGGVDPKYIPQVQGSMLVAERDWWEWLSYYPDPKVKPMLIRVMRDHAYISKLTAALDEFNDKMAEMREELVAGGWVDE